MADQKPFSLEWKTFEISYDAKRRSVDGFDQLQGLDERYVYVIELPKGMNIAYPNGESRICYIGRQGKRASSRTTRIGQHAKNWIAKYLILTQEVRPFAIHICHPRRRGDAEAFREIEAMLLAEFHHECGKLPLFNKRGEVERADYDVDTGSAFKFRRRASVAFTIDARDLIDRELLGD